MHSPITLDSDLVLHCVELLGGLFFFTFFGHHTPNLMLVNFEGEPTKRVI